MKYVLVTGGVLSGIGKGIIASSTGMIMKAMGLRVTSIKIDPYLNIDAGTMSPFEHGEVFVLDDGGEVDLDLGNYERFLDISLTRDNNITTGKIYNHVIEKERKGLFLGKTVQVVPHVCDEIQSWVERVAQVPADGMEGPPDVCIIELGGTVGDIESMPFIEAMRQFQFRVGINNFCLLHVSLVPVIGVVGEQKTKPSQMSVRELRALGLSPDIVVCRSQNPLTIETKKKLALFCHVGPDNVVGVHDVSNIYKVPLLLYQQGLPQLVISRLQLKPLHYVPNPAPPSSASTSSSRRDSQVIPPWLAPWHELANRIDRMHTNPLGPIHIAMVGKYTGLSDSYLSVVKAIEHASMEINRRFVIDWIEATNLEPLSANNGLSQDDDDENGPTPEKHEEAWRLLKNAHGILVPGGFGDRGVEGMIAAANYARVHGKPYLGICLGMQVAVIEFARSVLGWTTANSEELVKDANPAMVVFMPEISKTHMGATMRLGTRKTLLTDRNCVAAKLYGITDESAEASVDERHRHRYEVNPEHVPALQKAGLKFTGHDETKTRMEILEIDTHEFFLGTQFHPEFKSRPRHPSPPFVGLLLACWRQEVKKNVQESSVIPLLNKWKMSS